MAEDSWGDEVDEQKITAKKGIPVWVWGCGGGCLLMLIATIVVVAIGASWISDATDPDVQWPRVAEHLPHEERPVVHMIMDNPAGRFIPGLDMMMQISDPADGYQVMLLVGDEGNDVIEQMKNAQNAGLGELGGSRNAEQGTVVLEGHEAPATRYFATGTGGMLDDDPSRGPSIAIDISGNGQKDVLLIVTTVGDEEDELTDERLHEIVSELTYDVWHGRQDD